MVHPSNGAGPALADLPEATGMRSPRTAAPRMARAPRHPRYQPTSGPNFALLTLAAMVFGLIVGVVGLYFMK